MNVFEIIFFPGILFHEFSHFITCVLMGVKVGKVKFTSVTHQKTTPWKNFLIAFAPFVLGTLVGVLLLWVGHTGLNNLIVPSEMDYLSIGVFYWLGFGIVAFCFPSDTDARSAVSTLFDFYEDGLTLKKGRFLWVFSIITLIPVFVPLAAISAVMAFFANIRSLGVLWALALFLGVGFYVGLWSSSLGV